MPKKPKMFVVLGKILDLLCQDLSQIRLSVPGFFHPFRAVALARAAAGLSAAEVAKAMETSRSYLAALENYTRPVTYDMTEFFDRLGVDRQIDSNRWGIFRGLLEEILGVRIADIDPYIKYYDFTQKILRGGDFSADELKPQKVCAVFEALSFLPDFFEIVYREIPEQQYQYLRSASLWPPAWPSRQVPEMILCKPESILFAYLLGLVSVDQVIDVYEKRAAAEIIPYFQPFLLMSITGEALSTLYRFADSMALDALCVFLFENIVVDVAYRFPKDFPVVLKCTLKSGLSVNARHLPTVLNYINNGEVWPGLEF